MKKFKIISASILSIAMFACVSRTEINTNIETEVETETTMNNEIPNTLSQSEIDDGWILLFDGKTAYNFRGYNAEAFPEKGWEIVDGTIHVKSSGKGEAGGGGDIITRNKYKNFELSLEWKVSEGGNSGIFYLAQEKPDQPIWKSAPEMQILDNDKHPDAKLGVDGNRAAGALYDLIPGNKEVVKPAGEWNKVKVLVYKGTVVHTVNGTNVLEYHLWTDDWKNMVLNSKFKDYPDFLNTADEGYIGLQDHGDDVWFRNIKIKEL
jgi:alpha-3'-ketoglucosidase